MNPFFKIFQTYFINEAIFDFIFSECIKCVPSFFAIITTDKLQVDWSWTFQCNEFRFRFNFEFFCHFWLEIFYWNILIQRYKYWCWYFWLELNQTPLKYFEQISQTKEINSTGIDNFDTFMVFKQFLPGMPGPCSTDRRSKLRTGLKIYRVVFLVPARKYTEILSMKTFP